MNLYVLLRYPTPIFYFLMGPQCVHKHYIPPFSGIYVVVIGKKGGKLRRQILQPSQAIDFQSILIYGCGHIFKGIKLKLGVKTLFGCEFYLKSNPPNSRPRMDSPGEGGCILGVSELWPHF